MELEVKGTIETIGETVEGVNKAGDNWQKLTYTLTTEDRRQLAKVNLHTNHRRKV
jgi:hypothetical protein